MDSKKLNHQLGEFAGRHAHRLLVGEILQTTGSYVPSFTIAGSTPLVALRVIHLLVPKLAPAKL